MSKSNGVGQRIELDGGYVVMRPMTIDDMLAFSEVETNLGAAIRAVKDGCTEAKFKNGKLLGEQGLPVLTAILKAWNSAEDEVALPPASAPLSVLPSTGK